MLAYSFAFGLAYLFEIKDQVEHNMDPEDQRQGLSPWLLAMGRAPFVLMQLMTSGLLFLSVSGLFWFHSWLIAHNMTTHEQIKIEFGGRDAADGVRRHPFDTGSWWRNAVLMMCRPIYSTSTDDFDDDPSI